ncbi:MAG: type II secretion system F family protein [Planctomycetota bacterium]
MPDFSYVARDTAGQRVTGTIAAAGRREALATLSSRSLFPIEVSAGKAIVEPQRVRRVPAQQLAIIYSQMADLLRSGVPLLRTLEVLGKQTSNNNLRYVLEEVRHQVEDGATLAAAMGRFQQVFGEMAVSMVRAGGEGGFLEEALARVAEFTEVQEDLKKRTMGAMVYPLVLAVAGTAIVSVIIVFFVPKFATLFASLRERGELPALTEWVLWLSGVMRTYGLLILAAGGLGMWLVRRWAATPHGRYTLDALKLRVPMAGKIFLSLAVARFCRVLGTLLKNGVPILKSLDISSDATGNKVIAAAIDEASENISAGEPLAEPLRRSGRFPATVIEMIGVAEQANNLESVLVDIADGLERRTWRTLDLTVRLLEPLLLVLMAGAILVVVIALLMPVLKMSLTV